MVATSLQQEQDLKAWASTLPKKDVDVLRAFMAFLVTTPAETLQLPEFSGLDHPAWWRDKIATRLRGSAGAISP
jgi:hypothetical protein